MILDLKAFMNRERPHWEELERILEGMTADPDRPLSLSEVERVHHLYHRAASSLSKVRSVPIGDDDKQHLESLVARAHVELHDTRAVVHRWSLIRWLSCDFPAAVQRHRRALGLAVLVTAVGALFGTYSLAVDPEAKSDLLPFEHLLGNPAERVRAEESGANRAMEAHHSEFAASLMVNNISVSLRALAFGLFWGAGTLSILFYNGVILGAVFFDYIRAGQSAFLLGWLLPHGSVEIPAILIAGQAGLVLGHALLGWGDATGLRERLRRIGPDLVSLIAGASLLLVWAGIVEAFLSQYHEPTIPYALKIALGGVELTLLLYYLLGRAPRPSA
jgi:uncharacterized membrane protein SpoIIM required for sporulation